jgi:pyruvate dehydrogenase E2 component (dihydrolipoamide acetyltransferase)
MATDFKLPNLGENIESGDVVDVLVKEGDTIRAEQEVIELETEKAVLPVPCPTAGVVRKIHVKKGDTVPVGGVVLSLEAASSATKEPAEKEPPAAANKPGAPAKTQERSQKDVGEGRRDAKAAPSNSASESGTVREADGAHKARQRPAQPPEAGGGPAGPQEESQADRRQSTARPVAAPARVETPQAEQRVAAPPASPETRRYARELGVDIHQVRGSGDGGRITKEDVKAAVRAAFNTPGTIPAPPAAPADRGEKKAAASAREGQGGSPPQGESARDAWGPIRRAPLSRIRETIALNMARSASTIPHVTNFDDADITELERIRKGSMADYVGDVKLTMMSFVLKAVAMALKHHQEVNASLDLEQKQIIYKDYVNVGVAVDTPRGLVVPVMREVDKLSIPQIAQQMAKLAEDARNARFKVDDLRGGTFTVSNLGAVGGTYSTPIINHPEVAVLLVGRSRKLPVVVEEDQIQVRLTMPLSLSYDHRLVDGATAARFLNDVIEFLEVPGRLLLAP